MQHLLNTQFILALLISFSLTTFFILILRSPARKIRLIDISNSKRKHHKGVIPLIGGPSIFIGFILAFLTLDIPLDPWRIFITCLVITLLIGVLDDWVGVSVNIRVIIQALVGTLLLSAEEIGIYSFGNILFTGDLNFYFWALPITILAVLSSKNALNMMDGIDGLAGVTAFISLLSLLILGVYNDHVNSVKIISIQLIAIIPFLLANLGFWGKNRKVFLGDSGSTYLGFFILWFMIAFSQTDQAIIRPVTALWIFAIPLIDMVTISLRRLLKGNSIFEADRQHVHHILMLFGLTHKQTLIVISICHTVTATIGILAEIYQVLEFIMFASFILLFAGYAICISKVSVKQKK